MPKTTQTLSLYEYDPSSDDPKTTAFNVERMLNDNWDKIDEFAGDAKSHQKNVSNPHQVTAEQIGAAPENHADTTNKYGLGGGSYFGHVRLSDDLTSTNDKTKGTAATPAAVKAVSKKIDSHVNNKSNPHGTTCEQLGALAANDLRTTVLDLFYPVGTVYQTADKAFRPQTAWGGTWVQIKDVFLLGAGGTYEGGATGGEATHALTAAEGPKHTHASYVYNSAGTGTVTPDTGSMALNTSGATSVSGEYKTMWASQATQAAGAGTAHNNMPPYLAVYIWKRTA